MATLMFEQPIVDLLEKAVHEKFENFELQVQGANKGEGNHGDIRFVSLKNKRTGEDIHLVIKVMPSGLPQPLMEFNAASFITEIHYYTKIFPTLLDFQKSYSESKIFNNFPKCLGTCSDSESGMKLAIENLKFQNYESPKKTEPLSEKLQKHIFKTYAEFHALSYAFKDRQPKEFLEITKNLNNNWLSFVDNHMLPKRGYHFLRKVKGYLEEEGEIKISQKLDKYIENFCGIFKESVTYNGSYGTILHGDCWSNNLMIRYNKSNEVEHIKIIDFQLGFVGSPVIDLSYSLYSGAASESLDNLESLLKLYHNTLSDNLKKYGCDPEIIYPFEILKKEWKEHCCFGLLMGLLIWLAKLMTDIPDMKNQQDEAADFGIKFNEAEYRRHAVKLFKHMYENDFL